MDVPLWFGQERGSGFAPYDIDFGDESESQERAPADDVPMAMLGLLATVLVFACGAALTIGNLLFAIPIIVAGVVWLAIGAGAIICVASSEEFPARAGLLTATLAALGTAIKWAVLIGTVVFVVSMIIGLLIAASSDRR